MCFSLPFTKHWINVGQVNLGCLFQGYLQDQRAIVENILNTLNLSSAIISKIVVNQSKMIIVVEMNIDCVTTCIVVSVVSMNGEVDISVKLGYDDSRFTFWNNIYHRILMCIGENIGPNPPSINDTKQKIVAHQFDKLRRIVPLRSYTIIYPFQLEGIFPIYTEEVVRSWINERTGFNDFQVFANMINYAVYHNFSVLKEDDTSHMLIDILRIVIAEGSYPNQCSAVAVVCELCFHLREIYTKRMICLVDHLCNVNFSTSETDFDTAMLYNASKTALRLLCREADICTKVAECIDNHKKVQPDYCNMWIDMVGDSKPTVVFQNRLSRAT